MNTTTIIISLNVIVFIILIITLIHHHTVYKKIINVKEKYAPKINSNIKNIKNKIKKLTNTKLNKLKKELFKKDPMKYKIHRLKFHIDYTCDNCIYFYREHVINTGEIFSCCSKYNIKDNSLSDKKLRIRYCDKKYIDYKKPNLYNSSLILDPEISNCLSKNYTYWNKNKDFNNIQFDPNQKVIFTKNNPNLLIKEKQLLSVREAYEAGKKLRYFYDRDFKLPVNVLIEYLCIDYDIHLLDTNSNEYYKNPNDFKDSFCRKNNNTWEMFISSETNFRYNTNFMYIFAGIILNHELDENNYLPRPDTNLSILARQRSMFMLGFLAPKKIFIQKYYQFYKTYLYRDLDSYLSSYFQIPTSLVIIASIHYNIGVNFLNN